MLARWEKRLSTQDQPTDGWLLLATASLLIIGWVMVTSASSEIATSLTGNPYYFSIRHGVFVVFSVLVGLFALRIPLERWRAWGPGLLLVGVVLLIAVLFIGREVNGSKRWIPLGIANVQASEVAKLCLIVYFADYLQRYLPEVRRDWGAFLRPFVVLGVYVVLLIFEPDYGAIVVIGGCMMGMLLMSGAPLWRFGLVTILVVAAAGFLAVAEPYRLERITSFANPWADQYASGYQLTQALIAFGRGHWLGLGLGNSVQKLFYLPEAHTDFVFAVLAEELGLIGAVSVVCLFALLIFRGIRIGRKAELRGWAFSAYLCYGISLVFGAQAFINIAVSTGMLPTKGLTLPLLSYGGSSLVVSCVMVAMLLRVDAELRAKMRASRVARQAKQSEQGER
ncbi:MULTISPECIES: putative lipid II flippase FtsW [Chromohalobacter]|uniref:Probable peptidoglycan glycosyltransferase FtsW n=1 Tax=Chromohalobacter israelensis (strain ATCC BAA-138 / DSM 3043 / CIP 106854 / NCIMB 13768 / 1H11) TaxID=290398 RepID=Q1QVG6_CHRI1|nr:MULTISPECIES: putative lipid II flippase FtsW [Chromohalobacter]ABE59542.1 cell division-specific peptidoglycan biosynthesis regulator FtsW [Chromohalobacter salexigens DSM 3043]MBZ5874688.1 putative lipid II flippase FtsW [Chromohalobacter salexigens]MDF9433493.1 putative lipid II flippase FtsW [Chromohalobacter israelensis]MDO0946313.1 putative lipid II flippase FtsW [Chromohalobacter salexigens]NQY46109.1 putative lipid II flippase FtsW [Chromohalobacter sp.]